MLELPEWPEGTVAVLSTAGDAPHAIPVSLVQRAGPSALLVGLAPRRESLARLRADPRCAVTVLASGDVAVTAHGRAAAFEDAGGVVAVRVEVTELVDHNRPTYEIEGGVPWRWTDAEAEARDAEARAALRELAAA
jgi:nitroimidazol reductase NimA-like FMN-containing flavoprotein (pyridoxamine 5'-phosphate oxidase superfamily)